MQTKTVLFAPHMALLAAIANIVGIDFSTFKPLDDANSLATREQLHQATGLAAAIPLMKLKPEHVTEVTTTGAKLIAAMKETKGYNPTLVSQLSGNMIDAGNKLIDNNHVKQNGGADEPPVHSGAKSAEQVQQQ